MKRTYPWSGACLLDWVCHLKWLYHRRQSRRAAVRRLIGTWREIEAAAAKPRTIGSGRVRCACDRAVRARRCRYAAHPETHESDLVDAGRYRSMGGGVSTGDDDPNDPDPLRPPPSQLPKAGR
jgi:hypothetical protein